MGMGRKGIRYGIRNLYRLLLKNKIKYSIGRTEIIGAFFHFKEET